MQTIKYVVYVRSIDWLSNLAIERNDANWKDGAVPNYRNIGK